MPKINKEKILILDFGSQYTQIIARRVRESHVYCEIHPYNWPVSRIKEFAPRGLIFSGSPSSVYDPEAPVVPSKIYDLNMPILGICYGMQLLTHQLGGEVASARKREYGPARIRIVADEPLFSGIKEEEIRVWMSHGDKIDRYPPGFKVLALSKNSSIAAMGDLERKIFGLQFHPEVVHTPAGRRILNNFLFRVCGCKASWTMKSFIETTIEEIKDRVGSKGVICALSGGVDSSVVALLLHQAIGKQLHCIFVNNGLLRKNEAEQVQKIFGDHFDMDLHYVDASDQFLRALSDIEDPEKKRRIIGNLFIEIFEEKASKFHDVTFLAQGTLYPDVIESVSFKGPSATIKTHHNVGGLPEKMCLELLEPLRELFKDEVRQVGREIGLPEEIIMRHPFPGPGLAIRCLGTLDSKKLEVLREADAIVMEEMKISGWHDRVWQAFAVLLPVRTVGVMGDERTYEQVIAIRIVESVDAMTADWAKVPYDILGRMATRIINEVIGINRVVYDISSKPPSTIEWE